MSISDDLIWRETSPGRYERNIDELEMFYSSMAKTYEGMGRAYFAITAFVGISVPVSVSVPTLQTEQRLETAFRKAWKRLRYDHPTIAAPVSYDSSIKWCKKVYEICDGSADEWLEESFRTVDGQSGLDFANTDPLAGRFATLYFINPPLEPSRFAAHELRRDIVFRSTHDIIDGIGTLNLLNNLLRHATQAYAMQQSYIELFFGNEYSNLSPPFRVAACLPLVPTTVQSQKFETIQATNQRIRLTNKVLSIPFKHYHARPQRCQRVAIHLPATHTASIIQTCKELGVTPTHAFHAGIALAVRDLQEKAEFQTKGAYVSYALVNLRETCMIPFNTPLHCASVYHSVSAHSLVVPLTIPGSSDTVGQQSPNEFSVVLSQVASFYRDIKIDGDYLSTVPALFASTSPPYPSDTSSTAPLPAPNPTPSASLSSMGVIDKIIQPEHGNFTVTDQPWVIGAEYSPGVGVFLGTWKGVMELSAAYNEAFHTKEEVTAFLRLITAVVLQGLLLHT